MFNGRNRFNGFTTGKPVCVLRLDSGGTEVKRKNSAPEIHRKTLIINGFLPLTDGRFVVLGGTGQANHFAYNSPSNDGDFRNARYCIWPRGAAPRGKQSSNQLFTAD
jgi:hypothetical protein